MAFGGDYSYNTQEARECWERLSPTERAEELRTVAWLFRLLGWICYAGAIGFAAACLIHTYMEVYIYCLLFFLCAVPLMWWMARDQEKAAECEEQKATVLATEVGQS